MVTSPTNERKLGLRFAQALVFAFVLHAEQKRKGTDIPYISHLLGVAALVLEEGGSEDEAIAALLHDTIEDQGGPVARAAIEFKFGERVTEIVDGCTDAETTPNPPWHERKRQYIEHIPHASPEVLRVSLADKLHNARSTLRDLRTNGDKVWNRFNPEASKQDQLKHYRALVDAFHNAGGPAEMVEEFDRVVSEIEQVSSGTD